MAGSSYANQSNACPWKELDGKEPLKKPSRAVVISSNRSPVKVEVGAGVGALVGDFVGFRVGALVGDFVGFLVGALVGTFVGVAVGDNVTRTGLSVGDGV